MPGLIRIIEKYKEDVMTMIEERELKLTNQYAKVDENYYTIKAATHDIVDRYDNCAEIMQENSQTVAEFQTKLKKVEKELESFQDMKRYRQRIAFLEAEARQIRLLCQ